LANIALNYIFTKFPENFPIIKKVKDIALKEEGCLDESLKQSVVSFYQNLKLSKEGVS